MDFTKHVTNRRVTPQTEKVPGIKNQKRNNAGGISFKISKWDYLMRFLILGTEGSTYYVSERKMTRDACDNVQRCIDADGFKVVDTIVEVSKAGRSVNNDAAIFALAMCASVHDHAKVRKYALQNLQSVCRIGTHLFHFMKFVKTMRGTGRGLRNEVSKWYTDKSIENLAYQMLKYQGRDGWTHGDVIKLAHPKPVNDMMKELFAYATDNRKTIPKVSPYAIGMNIIRTSDDVKEVAFLIDKYNLTREAVPTQFLNDIKVWEALLPKMPIMALVRNLGKMSSIGMHKPFSESIKLTCDKLTDELAVKRSRIHPISIMNARLMYGQGCGFKGSLSWEINGKIMSALEKCFYLSFNNVEPTNKRILLALDISGSMAYRMNKSMMSCRAASAVLAMVTMRSERNTEIIGFTGDCRNAFSTERSTSQWRLNSVVSQLPLSKEQDFKSVVSRISDLDFGQTDCSLPMQYCIARGIDVDAIVIYTDNETYVGSVHPWQALDKLEQKLGHKVKSVVVGMTATEFSIAKPDYDNMLDVVGFDTNTPSAISEFIRN